MEAKKKGDEDVPGPSVVPQASPIMRTFPEVLYADLDGGLRVNDATTTCEAVSVGGEEERKEVVGGEDESGELGAGHEEESEYVCEVADVGVVTSYMCTRKRV